MYNHRVVTDEVHEQVMENLVSGGWPGVAPTNDWDDEQPYKYESYILPKVCIVEIDPTWLPKQEWWQEEFNELDVPRYLVRMGCTGNSGGEYLLNTNCEIWHKIYMIDGVGIEYGASGPAFNGCYCKEDRAGILQWIDELPDDMSVDNDIWF